MEYRHLGISGLEVSVIALGTTSFGRRGMQQEESTKVVLEAIEHGVNLIDTSNTYGPAEEFLGRAITGIRQDVVIATKVSSKIADGPNRSGSSRLHIVEQVEKSLGYLQTDYIDIYQLHVVDNNTPIEETLRAMDDLVRQGKVRYLGCSNFGAWQVSKAVSTSQRLGLNSFVCVQPEYNMLRREAESDLIPCCESHGLGILPYHPLDSGFLSGKYRRGSPIPVDSRIKHVPQITGAHLTEKRFDLLDRLDAFAKDCGHTILELAIAWLLSRPMVTSVLTGTSRTGQISDSVRAATWSLTPDQSRRIDRILTHND